MWMLKLADLMTFTWKETIIKPALASETLSLAHWQKYFLNEHDTRSKVRAQIIEG